MPAKKKQSSEAAVREIRRRARRRFSAEEKIRIVLEGLRGEESIAALCRREGIASNLYYRWSKEFLEAGKKRLAGDTMREATNDLLGLDQWLLGPEAAVAMVRPWGVLGVLVSHQWDVAGEDDFDTSITGGQYFMPSTSRMAGR